MKNTLPRKTFRLSLLLVIFMAFFVGVNYAQNVGIGIQNPTDKLHIYSGDLRIEDNYPFIFLNKLSASTNTGINFKENDVSKGFLVYTGIEDLLRMTTDSNGLRNDLVITSAGKVCIGTFSPHEFSQLHVAGGDIAISDESHPFLTFNSLSTNNNAGINMQENGVTKGWFYLDGGYDILRMSTDINGGRADFIMDQSGNIGLGTDTPSSKLHLIDGNLTIEHDNPYLFLKSNLNGSNSGIRMMENGSSTSWLYYDSGEDVLRVSTHANGNRNDLAITTAGNVGIGTAIPSNKLHVFGGDAEIEDYYPYLYLNDTTPSGGKAGIAFQYLDVNKAIFNYDITADLIKLSTDDNAIRNDITINSLGNIGMGTSNPAVTNKLHVVGGDIQVDDAFSFVILNSTAAGNNAGISLKENGSTTGWVIYQSALDVLKLSTESSGNRNDLTINASGNVGIGTATPTSALHVEGTIEVDQKIQADDAGGLEFATDEGTTRMVIVDDGDVGIGIATPDVGSRLHISGGDLSVTDDNSFIYLEASSATGNSGMVLKQSGNYKGWFSYSDASDVVRITTESAGGRNDLTVNSLGNVGIGTASISERLHLKANGSAKIRVEGSGSNVLAMEFFNLSTFGGSLGYSITNDYLFFYHGGNVIVKDGSLGVGQNTIGAGRKIDVLGGGYCSGTNWVNSSDRRLKENLSPVSGQGILEKIRQLDITEWNYTSEGIDVRHIGPMAQDFYALFGIGYDATSISTLDADGVSLAAIKALLEENQELKGRLAQLEERLIQLEKSQLKQ